MLNFELKPVYSKFLLEFFVNVSVFTIFFLSLCNKLDFYLLIAMKRGELEKKKKGLNP